MSKTNLSVYFPNIYKDVLEIDTLIEVENELFGDLNSKTTEVEDNQFVLTSNSRGLEVFEKMLKIIANPAIESIQFRRERIINRLSTALPYTLRYLKRRLNSLLGVDNYDLEVIYDDYILHLVTYVGEVGKLDELLRTLFAVVPVNLQQTIENKIIEEGSAKLFLGQVADVAKIYNLSSDISTGITLNANTRAAQVADIAKIYNLSSDISTGITLNANTKAAQVADIAKIYNLSSDISTGITLNANTKAAQVVSPGMIYNIE